MYTVRPTRHAEGRAYALPVEHHINDGTFHAHRLSSQVRSSIGARLPSDAFWPGERESTLRESVDAPLDKVV
eukprot:6033276-Pyramimonas_sp.AAC.1